MSEIDNESLKKTSKGTIIALVGTLAGVLLAFISRVIIARFGMESQYGIFSLVIVVVNLSVLLATMGITEGATRYIAYFRARDETSKIQGTVSASIQLTSLASILLSLLLFFTSGIIATKIFHDSGLVLPLRVSAFCIPFLTLTNAFISIFLGFDSVKENVYFQSILSNLFFLLALVVVALLGLPFISIFYGYLISAALCTLVLVLYTVKRLPLKLVSKASTNLVRKELLLFSLPLLGVAVLQMVISWTATLMLGYFKTPDIVGLYNAASPLAQFIFIPMGAMLLIYAPVTSGLYAQNLVPEIRRNYAILTKWIFSVTLPIFLILLLFPEAVLGFLFGADFIPASQALRILSLGYIMVNLLGPNGTTLMAMGKTRFLMWASMAAAGANVILNIILIPPLGIMGAAIATSVSLTLHCIIRHVKVHSTLRVNPLTKNLLKPAIISIGLISLVSFLLKSFVDVTFWMLPLLFILFYAICFMGILFSRSFDREDIMMLAAIEKRVGINATPIKKMLKRFL